jgi:hypothetical protein
MIELGVCRPSRFHATRRSASPTVAGGVAERARPTRDNHCSDFRTSSHVVQRDHRRVEAAQDRVLRACGCGLESGTRDAFVNVDAWVDELELDVLLRRELPLRVLDHGHDAHSPCRAPARDHGRGTAPSPRRRPRWFTLRLERIDEPRLVEVGLGSWDGLTEEEVDVERDVLDIEVGRLACPSQRADVGKERRLGAEPSTREELTEARCLPTAALGERRVLPALETPRSVSGRLAVPQQIDHRWQDP